MPTDFKKYLKTSKNVPPLDVLLLNLDDYSRFWWVAVAENLPCRYRYIRDCDVPLSAPVFFIAIQIATFSIVFFIFGKFS